jgi:hypothetical protein
MASADQGRPKGNLPPYISFRTLTGFAQKLKETTVPGRIDSSVLRSYAGSVARQLVLTLKWLQLIDGSGGTNDRLKKLVAAYGTPEWKEQLSNLIFEVYQPVVGNLDLDTGTHQQLLEAFRKAGADGVVLERAVAFFLAALKEAGTTVSPHFTDRPRRPRSANGRKKQKSKKADEDADELEDEEDGEPGGDEADSTKPARRARFQINVPGKRHATIMLPADVSGEDWTMIDLMMKAYVARLEKVAKQA